MVSALNNLLKRLFARSAWRGSTLQVIAAIVLPLTLLLVASSFGSFFIHQNAMRSMVGERDERAVRAAASAIESEIHHRMDSLRGLAYLAGDGSKENLNRALSDSSYLLDDFDHGLAFFSKSGDLLVASGNTDFWNTVPNQIDLAAWKTQKFLGVHTLSVDGKPVILAAFVAPDGSIAALGAFSADMVLRVYWQKTSLKMAMPRFTFMIRLIKPYFKAGRAQWKATRLTTLASPMPWLVKAAQLMSRRAVMSMFWHIALL
jgi:hypothetical protein